MVEEKKPESGSKSERETGLALADGEHAVNYMTEQKEQAEQEEQPEQVRGAEPITETGAGVKKIIKTYRIVKGHPEAGIFEKELFDKYFGTVLGNCPDHSE